MEPLPQNAGRKPAFFGEVLRKLEQDLERRPDATLSELRDRSGLAVSLAAVHRTIKKLGFTRKKRLYVRTSSSGRT